MTGNSDARRLWSRKACTLTPYVPGEQPQERILVKLNTNENPYPPPYAVQKAICAYPADRLRLYPDPASRNLRRALADYFVLAEQQVFVGNGSDEILAFAFQAFFNSHDPAGFAPDPSACIVFPDITYSFYPVYARMYDVPCRTVPLDSRFRIVPEDLKAPSAGIVLANPNAPTGIAVGLDVLEELAGSDPNRLLLIDEAYVDFGAESAVPLLARHDNILIVQTLSKSRALAGLRVGFALGSPSLIEALERVRDSFNSYTLDSLAQAAAIAALGSAEWFESTRARIMATREKSVNALLKLGFDVLPSDANFIFACHRAFTGEILYRALRQKSILVRHFKLPRIEDYVRITIGSEEDMDTLAEALSNIIAGSGRSS